MLILILFIILFIIPAIILYKAWKNPLNAYDFLVNIAVILLAIGATLIFVTLIVATAIAVIQLIIKFC